MAEYFDNAVSWRYVRLANKAGGSVTLFRPTPNAPKEVGKLANGSIVRAYQGVVSNTFFPDIQGVNFMQTPVSDGQGTEYTAIELFPQNAGQYWAAYPAEMLGKRLPTPASQKGDSSATTRRVWVRSVDIEPIPAGQTPAEREDWDTLSAPNDGDGDDGNGATWLLALAGVAAIAGAPAVVPISLAVLGVAMQTGYGQSGKDVA